MNLHSIKDFLLKAENVPRKSMLALFLTVPTFWFVANYAAEDYSLVQNNLWFFLPVIFISIFFAYLFMLLLVADCVNLYKRVQTQKEEADRLNEVMAELDEEELFWIQYCLHAKKRTLLAREKTRLVVSLLSKNIIEHKGSCNISDGLFRITDNAWTYIQDNPDKFMLDRQNKEDDIEFYEQKIRVS